MLKSPLTKVLSTDLSLGPPCPVWSAGLSLGLPVQALKDNVRLFSPPHCTICRSVRLERLQLCVDVFLRDGALSIVLSQVFQLLLFSHSRSVASVWDMHPIIALPCLFLDTMLPVRFIFLFNPFSHTPAYRYTKHRFGSSECSCQALPGQGISHSLQFLDTPVLI